jgi:hypothetical protein
MDTLILVMLALFGLVSFALATLEKRASFALSVLAWVVGIPCLAFYCIGQLMRTDAYSLVEWTGEAEMGPITLILTTIGVSLWVCGGIDGKRKVRRN